MAFARFNNRKIWFGMLLLLTVLAAVWPVEDKDILSPEMPDRAARGRHSSHADALTVNFSPLIRDTVSEGSAIANDLFPQQTWAPPSPPVVPQTPSAPPLPFTFGGRYIDGTHTTIFLVEGNQMHRVQQGETINGTYRVEKIEQSSITLIYLPLGTPQILSTGVPMP